jgi:hypothetical protein
MKKNQVPRPRAIAATIQPIHTSARAARSLLRSEGIPIPDCLAGERLFHPPGAGACLALPRLKEPTKGSTVTFIDNAPTAKKVHGFPTKISPGDEVVLTNQLFENGGMVGKLRSRCTATDPSGGSGEAVFINAHSSVKASTTSRAASSTPTARFSRAARRV